MLPGVKTRLRDSSRTVFGDQCGYVGLAGINWGFCLYFILICIYIYIYIYTYPVVGIEPWSQTPSDLSDLDSAHRKLFSSSWCGVAKWSDPKCHDSACHRDMTLWLGVSRKLFGTALHSSRPIAGPTGEPVAILLPSCYSLAPTSTRPTESVKV
jgi:hypothetical protein